MQRIPPLEPGAATGRAREIFDDFLRERGNIPNMFRTLARSPRILDTTFAHFRAVMSPGAVSMRVKEMVAVRVSYSNGCTYCLGSHTKLARQFGVTEGAMARLQLHTSDPAAPTGGIYNDAERAALLLTDAMASGGNDVPEEIVESVRKHFGDDGFLEIVMVAGLFHYFNRVNNTLRIEVTK